MNRKQHIIIGTVSFVAFVYLLLQVRQFEDILLLVSYAALLVGSVMPDIVDPPTSFKHRGYGHSKRLLWNMTLLFLASTVLSLIIQYVLVAPSFSLGYIFHLLADSTTKVGLMD